MLLQDEFYEDDNGKEIKASTISHVAAFTYIIDGFFRWTCPVCRKDNSSRAFKINGTVHRCGHCSSYSLLLRSDCSFMSSIAIAIQLNTSLQWIEETKSKISKLQTEVEKQEELVKKLVEQNKEKQNV